MRLSSVAFALLLSLLFMYRWCSTCHQDFPTTRGIRTHYARRHRHPKPRPERVTGRSTSLLNAIPCDDEGTPLAPDQPPEPFTPIDGFAPFQSREQYEFAALQYGQGSSVAHVKELLNIMKARDIRAGNDTPPIFDSYRHMVDTIDDIPVGESTWHSFSLSYNGPVDANSPPWKKQQYPVYTRNARTVSANMLGNPAFDGKTDYVAYEEWKTTGDRDRVYSDPMSGTWASQESAKIALDPATHGAMLAPIILGADKTTVSVHTGSTEYHPVYFSLANIRNDMRRAHRDAVVVLAFLAIPPGSHGTKDDDEFRIFKKQLYHQSLAHILSPLRDAMSTPTRLRCPDGHFRRVIFSLGPFIADYPEQVYLAGIVSGWCPKCFSSREELEAASTPRFRDLDHRLKEVFDGDPDMLWDAFGINARVKPFTDYFPRADIHQLLTPDLLHQLIKNTFKEHLVTWVFDYIKLTHAPAEAKLIMDDIDNRLACVAWFPGLRQFHQGRNFKQWTGDDSKGLMKIFIPAISGHVPEQMVRCITAFTNFCYLARLSSHSTSTLARMDRELARFNDLRSVFLDHGVRDNFTLPCQHSLVHYVPAIRLFGSPNGLCSSITESKHVRAVKIPWRESNRNNPLPQMLAKVTRRDKLAAARTFYGRQGLLTTHIVDAALLDTGELEAEDMEGIEFGVDIQDEWTRPRVGRVDGRDPWVCRDEAMEVDGGYEDLSIQFSKHYRYRGYVEDSDLPQRLKDELPGIIGDFLYQEHNDAFDQAPQLPHPPHYPHYPFTDHVSIHNSARAVFYAPSEISGPDGMHAEIIRSTPNWWKLYDRRDTVLVQIGDEDDLMRGLVVARVHAFLTFEDGGQEYTTAVVSWFQREHDIPEPATGMWTVVPEYSDGPGEQVRYEVIHSDCIVRACHLIPDFGEARLRPDGIHYSESLDAFRRYNLSKYADYHTFECYPTP